MNPERHDDREARLGRPREPERGTRAADIMTTHPRTLRPSDTVARAIELLRSVSFRHLPVVDDEGKVIGMLTDRNIEALVEPYAAAHHEIVGTMLVRARAPVAALMSRTAVQAPPDTPIARVIRLLLDHRIGAVPIVDPGGKLVGIVSYQDVLRSMLGPT
jgi:CBS domain-containing protein